MAEAVSTQVLSGSSKYAKIDHSIFATSRQLGLHGTCDQHVGGSLANNMPRRPILSGGPTMR